MGYGFKTGSGGGATGAKLTVNAPAGCTVTVSKDGKTKNKVADSSGVAVFKGLSTGDWTVTSTDGSKTATKTVTITTDYATMITFFKATINVIYPAGSVCTATYGVTTLTAPDTSGTWACEVPYAGTWTIAVVAKGLTDTVDITEENQTVDVYLDKYYLYRLGDYFEDRSGGLVTDSALYIPDSGSTCGYCVYGDTYVAIYSDASAYCYTECRTARKIDLTNFRAIEVNILQFYPAYSEFNCTGIFASSVGHYGTCEARTIVYANGINQLDVSGLTGEYYIGVSLMRQEREHIPAIFNMIALI